jgi:hypothetical protein
MRTCSTHHQVIGSGHPLNGGLRGYYRGRYPGYHGPPVTTKILVTIGSLQRQMAGEPYTPYQEMPPPFQAKEQGPPT